jgi:hypothetical protein
MSHALRLVGHQESPSVAAPRVGASEATRRHGYRFEEIDRPGRAMNFMAVPVFAADGSIDMRALTTTGDQLRLAEQAETDRIINVGDELFGSTVTDLFVLDRRPNADRFAFSYELADGRFGTAVATRCA